MIKLDIQLGCLFLGTDRLKKAGELKMKPNAFLKENARHGDVLFPIAVYDIPHPTQPILPVHWHEELEIFFMVQGHADIRINEQVFQINPGSVVLIPSNALHSAFSRCIECHYYAIVFSDNYLASQVSDLCQTKFIDRLAPTQFSTAFHVPSQTSMEHSMPMILREIKEEYFVKHPGYELGIKGRLLTLISKMFQLGLSSTSGRANPTDEKSQSCVRAVITYIEENYENPISITDLAAKVFVSPNHLCRLFNRYTGRSPVRYISMVRMAQAARMIQSGDCTIREAALAVGFDNFSYFTKTFKQHYSVTPHQFKHVHQQSAEKQPEA